MQINIYLFPLLIDHSMVRERIQSWKTVISKKWQRLPICSFQSILNLLAINYGNISCDLFSSGIISAAHVLEPFCLKFLSTNLFIFICLEHYVMYLNNHSGSCRVIHESNKIVSKLGWKSWLTGPLWYLNYECKRILIEHGFW